MNNKENQIIFEKYLEHLIEARRMVYFEIIRNDPEIGRIVRYLEDNMDNPNLDAGEQNKVRFLQRQLRQRLEHMNLDWWGIPRIDDVLRPRRREPYIPSTIRTSH